MLFWRALRTGKFCCSRRSRRAANLASSGGSISAIRCSSAEPGRSSGRPLPSLERRPLPLGRILFADFENLECVSGSDEVSGDMVDETATVVSKGTTIATWSPDADGGVPSVAVGPAKRLDGSEGPSSSRFRLPRICRFRDMLGQGEGQIWSMIRGPISSRIGEVSSEMGFTKKRCKRKGPRRTTPRGECRRGAWSSTER
jgi:hypothetical protein